MKFLKANQQKTIEIFLIVVIAALAYLPNITNASIYRDDWYYALDRTIGGPGVFQEMFSIDRPARGPLFEAYYQLFNVQPLPYHLSSFLWRLCGGFAAFSLFNLLWPGQRRAALFMALLFTLFPGYSRWLEGFENQPRILSSFLEALSIALTLKAIKTVRIAPRVALWAGSILTGWTYIALVDFSFGMEFFRLLSVFLLVSHDKPGFPLIKKAITSLKTWGIAASIPFGFLFWRIFIFHNERPTTDIGLQLSFLTESPLHTGLLWLIRLFQSTVNISLLAWTMPPAQTIFNYRVSEIFLGIFLALLAVLALGSAEYLIKKITQNKATLPVQAVENWQSEAIIIGLFGVVAGVVPVIMANRFATLGNYSHYALPASLASVAFVGGVVFSITAARIKTGIMSLLVFLSVLTQYTISMRIIQEETTISNFWQQVVWRAPGIQAGTTLVVNYPAIDYGQDVDTVAGPANFLYFPEQTNQIPAIYQLSALEQGDNTSKDILENPTKAFTFRYRTHESEVSYEKLLVISQPTENSCVHVLDGNWPRISVSDPYRISLIAPLSKIDRVLWDGTPPQPDKAIFGDEPAHAWCYYYQKAELSLQNKDWTQIVFLGDEVFKQKLRPTDTIEWMPFLQAYAYTGNVQVLGNIAKAFKQEPTYKKQACQVLQQMNDRFAQYPLTPSVLAEIKRLFCED
jgi:hypothetical protein